MFQLGSFGNADGHPWGHCAWADLPVWESSVNWVSVGILSAQGWRVHVTKPTLAFRLTSTRQFEQPPGEEAQTSSAVVGAAFPYVFSSSVSEPPACVTVEKRA